MLRHPVFGFVFTVLGVTQLALNVPVQVVDGQLNAFAHGAQRQVQVLHHRVVIAAAGQQFVAVLLGAVVVGYLGVDVAVGQSDAHRIRSLAFLGSAR
jgi:hypothetical protein